MKILIRDNTTGKVVEYGSSPHHALNISYNGGCLTFENLQNGDGTLENGEGGYSFVLDDGKTPEESNLTGVVYGYSYANIGGFNKELYTESQPKLMSEQETIYGITSKNRIIQAIYNDTEDEDDGI